MEDQGSDSATLSVIVAMVLLIAAIIAFFSLTARLLDLLRPRRLYDLLREGVERAIEHVYPHQLEDEFETPGFPIGEKRIWRHRCRRLAASQGPDRLRRTYLTQDPAFGIRAIFDIAIRALSPAVNDPTTGSQVLDVLESLLHRLSVRDPGDGYLRDAEGELRVIHHAPGWKDLIDLSLTEIRHYGGRGPSGRKAVEVAATRPA